MRGMDRERMDDQDPSNYQRGLDGDEPEDWSDRRRNETKGTGSAFHDDNSLRRMKK